MEAVAMQQPASAVKGRFKRRLWGNDQQYRIVLYELVEADETAPDQIQHDGTFVAKGNFLPENRAMLFRYSPFMKSRRLPKKGSSNISLPAFIKGSAPKQRPESTIPLAKIPFRS